MSTATAPTADLLDRARAWAAEDPDPVTRAELEGVVADVEAGGDAADLADRFAGTLEFGTAGLRGALGAGPNRMNRVVVIRAAAGLAAYLKDTGAAGGSRRHRVRRPAQQRRLRPRHRRGDDRGRVQGDDSCRGRCRPPCWPSRSASSAASPA